MGPDADIGIDFDNTIVCCDVLFRQVALEKNLIPANLPYSKTSVRDWLRQQGREPEWTELQGHVYGVALRQAQAFPGLKDAVRAFGARGLRSAVVSHKTKHPFLGPAHDLHATAWGWLQDNGLLDPGSGLEERRVFLELTKKAKLERIGALGCRVFIDDLPEFLEEASFPQGVTRILFDPNDEYPGYSKFTRARSWSDIARLVASMEFPR